MLRRISDPAPVVDQRVACVKPTLANLRLETIIPPNARFSGQMTIGNGSYPMLQDLETQPYINFTCALPSYAYWTDPAQGMTMTGRVLSLGTPGIIRKATTQKATRHQLGASLAPGSFDRRGVLALGPKSQRQAIFNRTDTIVPANELFTRWLFSYAALNTLRDPLYALFSRTNTGANSGVTISEYASQVDFIVHETQRAVFHDTLRATKSPALAFQALLARLYQMVYYGHPVEMELRANASTSFSIAALIPVQWAGFTVSMDLIAAHFTIVVLVTAFYAIHP
ncbi:hypothetical protein BBP40_010287 [Aspergillus hancockii]|nr:hypothetical protein BBP40_010287 [Aspergillus hancockii]